ncbi:MAG: tetratricopeptide repeat protein [Deltaproteobacteria bacterium]|nr:tetratricopeptide repeat protein [Deltaproteobacteria bacterium]
MAVFLAASPAAAGGEEMFLLGQRSMQANNFDRAIAYFTEALNTPDIDSKTTAAIYGWRGLAWAGKGSYDKALEDLSQAIEKNPADGTLWLNRGSALRKKKDYGKAIEDYTAALARNPDSYAAHLYRGISWQELKNLENALKDLSRSIEIDPQRPAAYYQRALLFIEQGDGAKALKDALRCRELDEENPYYVSLVERLQGR